MISVIDAMTPIERKFSNVLKISEARRQELAAAAGVKPQEVLYLLGGRHAVEYTKKYLNNRSDRSFFPTPRRRVTPRRA